MSENLPPEVSDLESYSRSAGFDRLGWMPPTERLTLDQWDAIADYAHGLEKMLPFAIGDIVIYAQSQGKEYEDQAMQRLNIKPQTGYNCAVISRLFPRTLRWLDGNMTAQHHKSIAKLARKDMERAQALLQQAQKENWSARQLREHVAPPRQPPATASEAPETTVGDTSDYRDALLAQAAGIIELYAPDCELTADWLKRYENHTREVKETNDNQR